MKNKLLFIALALSLSLSTTVAEDNTYGSVGISVVDTDELDGTGVGPLFKLGYLFSDKKNSFGVEIEANPMFADMDNNNSDESYGNSSNRSSGMGSDFAMTLGTSLVYNYEIGRSGFTFRPKLGVILPNIGEDIYADSTSLSYGASMIYDFGGANGYISYDSLGSSTSRYSLGVMIWF